VSILLNGPPVQQPCKHFHEDDKSTKVFEVRFFPLVLCFSLQNYVIFSFNHIHTHIKREKIVIELKILNNFYVYLCSFVSLIFTVIHTCIGRDGSHSC
jgi:hypothetical protein